MRSRLAALAIAIVPMAAPAAGQENPAPPPAYRLGLDALAGRLWDVAVARFKEALTAPDLDPALRADLLLHLAEAHIRAGRGQPALEILEDPAVADHPARPFWTAQALAAAGRFRDALDTLDRDALQPAAPHRDEALLTKAKLLRALGDSSGALAAIDALLAADHTPPAARLLKARLLLDLNQPLDALAELPEDLQPGSAAAKEAALLRARALLSTSEFQKAVDLFSGLIDAPENQSLSSYHAATLGLARARLALGAAASAADGLLAFIQQNPASPRLGEAFDLLLEALPMQPAPTDPILTRLRAWLPLAPVSPSVLFGRDGGAAGAHPVANGTPDTLAPQALFHLALGLRRLETPEGRAEARRLLHRLRIEFPQHPVVPRALLEAARWDLEDGRRTEALAHLGALRQTDAPTIYRPSPAEASIRAQALALEGRTRFQDAEYDAAAAAFDRSASLLEAEKRDRALLNAAASLLAGGNLPAFDQLQERPLGPALEAQLALERALYLAAAHDAAALPALRNFLAAHPNHPRQADARLATALVALDAAPPDVGFARAQLEKLTPSDRDSLPPDQLALAELRLHDRLGQHAAAATRAQNFLDRFPTHRRAPLLRFELGKALFLNKDYNAARLVLQRLAQENPDSAQTPAAILLSARAASQGATPQSQAESLELFDQLIDSSSIFADVARLEKAGLLIQLSQLSEAIDLLDPWFGRMENDDPLLLSVGLLLGDALFASSASQPAHLDRAVEVYDRLLAALPADAPARPRVLYHKGLTLEQLPGREDDALVTYVDVIQTSPTTATGDWKSIELCGFSALRILEKREQWQAAKKLAERIAALGGPRSDEAAARAKALGLEHMIWEN